MDTCPLPPSEHSWPPFVTLVSLYHWTQYIHTYLTQKNSKGAMNTNVTTAMDTVYANHMAC